MGIFVYTLLGGMAGLGWYLYLSYWTQTKTIASPFLKVKRAKGKKILLLVDTGTGKYNLVAAKREALGYKTEDYGNFEAYEEGIKPFGFGNTTVPMGLAHAELEVIIPPAVAIWIEAHGLELTRENVDSLPDSFSYFACTNEPEKGKPCGWISPLIPAEDAPSTTNALWKKIVDFTRNEKNIVLPKPLPKTKTPECPDCGMELKEIYTDRRYSEIPSKTLYNLSNVRTWVEEVVSPLNMDMAIKVTEINTRRKLQGGLMNMLPYLAIIGAILVPAALAYVILSGSMCGGGAVGTTQHIGTTLKSGAGQ